MPRAADDATKGELEIDIAQSLEARGWKVQRRIGFSELRVDVAVEDPDRPGHFLLGIECDGDDYATAETARDRDRLRPQVLAGLGWRLLRVWPPDWAKNPDAQLARILHALDVASSAAANVAVAVSASPQKPSAATVALSAAPAPQSDMFVTQALDSDSDDVTATLPVGAIFYQECSLSPQGAPDDFYVLAQSSPRAIAMALQQVVEGEGPIHLQAATRRVVAAWGMSKTGGKLLRTVEEAARRLHAQKLLQRRGDFLWPVSMQRPAVRVPVSFAAPHPVEDIALEEIAEAAFLCVRDCFGVARDELVVHSARLLGYKQTGIKVRSRIEAALLLLQDDERVEVSNDSFSLAGNN